MLEMKLVVAEKPSVAFALSKALGIKGGRKDGYIEGMISVGGNKGFPNFVYGRKID